MFTLESPAFSEGALIPPRYTCEGENVSPPLRWSEPPAGTRCFALIVDDPDAPDPAAPKRVWVHWLAWNLPASLRELPEGATGALPAPAREGRHDDDGPGYDGPCPPIGTHRYRHTLFALDAMLPDMGSETRRRELEGAMRGHVLAQHTLTGLYRKSR